MKKKIICLLIGLFCLIPFVNVDAKVVADDLDDLVSLEMTNTEDDDDYEDEYDTLSSFDESLYKKKHDNAKVTVYIFYGDGCPHCLEAIVHFADIYSSYSNKIDVVGYEVWSNDDNVELANAVADELDTEVSGVPFIVIGDEYFSGYGSSLDDDIEEAIDAAYKDSSYTDVVKSVLGEDQDDVDDDEDETDEDEDEDTTDEEEKETTSTKKESFFNKIDKKLWIIIGTVIILIIILVLVIVKL